MSTTEAHLTVAGIDVEVVYKSIKNLHIAVYPPTGRVRIAAPLRLEEDAVRRAVVQRLPWIKERRRSLRDAARQTEREMVSGESHYLWGRRYRLDVTERLGAGTVQPDGDWLKLGVRLGSSTQQRRRVLEDYYRAELRQRLTQLIHVWQPLVERPVADWGVRKMKTKWASCSPNARIWFNLELAKKDPRCVEYVVVHELVHLLERDHNERFASLMDHLLSDWRTRRNELDAAPLGDQHWP